MAYNEDVVCQGVQLRQKRLLGWGFECRCQRCVAEGELPDGILERMYEINKALSGDQLAPGRLRQRYRALNGMPPARAAQAALRLLAEVQELLGADEASLRSAVKTAASSGGEDENQNPLVNWGLASVLEAYRLGTACAQAAGDIASTMQLQHKSLRAITATRPGGTEHVTIAIIHAVDTAGARRLSAVAGARGRRDSPAKQALTGALRAIKTRYGRELPDAVAIKLGDRIVESSVGG